MPGAPRALAVGSRRDDDSVLVLHDVHKDAAVAVGPVHAAKEQHGLLLPLRHNEDIHGLHVPEHHGLRWGVRDRHYKLRLMGLASWTVPCAAREDGRVSPIDLFCSGTPRPAAAARSIPNLHPNAETHPNKLT